MTLLSLTDLASHKSFSNSSIDTRELSDSLEHGRLHLKQQFEENKDIVQLVKQRSIFVDEAIQSLWGQYMDIHQPISLLAVGGYGRGELHPYSDVDLLILIDKSLSEQSLESISLFLTKLWDVGLEIGHSVRTLKECRDLAEQDITIATNLLETRLLSGSTKLFESLQKLTVTNRTWNKKQFYEQKMAEQKQRHSKYNRISWRAKRSTYYQLDCSTTFFS